MNNSKEDLPKKTMDGKITLKRRLAQKGEGWSRKEEAVQDKRRLSKKARRVSIKAVLKRRLSQKGKGWPRKEEAGSERRRLAKTKEGYA